MAEVISIPKTEKPATIITSNSLISFLYVLGKILDKIIQYHLLENNQTRHNNLYSAIQELQRVTENIIMEKNKKRTIQPILLDF